MMTSKEKFKNDVELFKLGFMNQIENSDTLIAGTMVGIFQGLKCKGSLLRGVKAGAAVTGAIALVNGFRTVAKGYDDGPLKFRS